jgi:hypothetical protein
MCLRCILSDTVLMLVKHWRAFVDSMRLNTVMLDYTQ